MTIRFAKRLGGIAVLALAAIVVPWHLAWAKDWVGPTGDWHTGGNWNPAGVPADGETVTVSVANAVISLTNATATLGSFDMTGGKLVFSNWTTRLIATNVTLSGGTVSVANAFTETEMSNRVWIVCSNNFTLSSPGRIDVSWLGYANNAGPGKGTSTASTIYGGGGGHGGKGGVGYYDGGPAYDSLTEPGAPGSGGSYTNQGGNGGGVVRIEAGGTATVSGVIAANGQTGIFSYGGGGAGGSICVVSATFTGATNGLLQANGASRRRAGAGGGGGGGRIALIGGTVSSPLLVRFATAPGNQTQVSPYGALDASFADWGTVYIADTNLFAGMPRDNQFTKTVLQAGAATNWTVSQLTLTNNSFRLIPDGFLLTVAGDLTIGANAELGIRGSISCGGNLLLTNSGLLTVYSGPTNAPPSYGALVNVAGNLLIGGDNSWLRPHTDPTNGGGVLLQMQNLAITHTNAGINASGRGYGIGQGPGKGGPTDIYYPGGGGYGGSGESGYGAAATGGPTNGNPYAPLSPGSGGGARTNSATTTNASGFGGGLIRVEAANSVTMIGQLVALGGYGCNAYEYGAGGAGGGILVSCLTFTGSSNAVLNASGGWGVVAGAGGGGRIAVWYGRPIPESIRAKLLAGQVPRSVVVTNRLATFEGTISVTNGSGGSYSPLATTGTVVFLEYPVPNGTFISVF